MRRDPATDDLFSKPKPARKRKPQPSGDRSFAAYAEVAVNQPVDDLYTYGIPASLAGAARVGSLVEASFAGRMARGCIVGFSEGPPEGIEARRIKPIHGVLAEGYFLEPRLVELARWISDYYLSPPGDAMGCASFLGFNDSGGIALARYALAAAGAEAGGDGEAKGRRLGSRQKLVLEALGKAGEGQSLTAAQLAAQAGATGEVLRRMVAMGLLVESHEAVDRGDDYGELPAPDASLPLNPAQQIAVDRLVAALDAGVPRTFLIHGVTGSGKTEVYLQAIRHALGLGAAVVETRENTAAEGGGAPPCAIVLVPEIGLTPQAVERFRARFGDIVGVYHSRLTLGQKFDLWQRIKAGKTRILVGARSAVFAPFENLRIVIVDEEHEASYKQDSSPRYHARDVAILRGAREGAVVVLGSATPSIESYFKAQQGKFELLSLPSRVDRRPLPPVRVVDMTQEARDEKNPTMFSGPLMEATTAALGRGEQVLLFLNRRGFFNFQICLDCQEVARCKHCDVSLTYHKTTRRLLCHYCNREYAPLKRCPACESEQMTMLGIGTQRVEEEVGKLFPAARIARMDLDTTRRRTAYLDMWRRIERGQVDVILGTQMISKGVHLENVTVVGVPLADVSLFQPDFRGAERAFSSLTQVAGRAGRGEKPGEVFVQTFAPHHYAVRFAQEHDYRGFYDKELRIREVLRFPPHHRLASVLLTGPDEDQVAEAAQEFARLLRDRAYKGGDRAIVLGPVPAPISRIKDQWRWRMLLRAKEPSVIHDLLVSARRAFREARQWGKVMAIIDVDPQDLL